MYSDVIRGKTNIGSGAICDVKNVKIVSMKLAGMSGQRWSSVGRIIVAAAWLLVVEKEAAACTSFFEK